MLKVAEIRGLAPDEMEQKVEALKKDLLTLRVELRMGKLEKHDRIRDIKKSIARLLTILRETEQDAKKQPAQGAKNAKKETKKETAKAKKAEKVKK